MNRGRVDGTDFVAYCAHWRIELSDQLIAEFISTYLYNLRVSVRSRHYADNLGISMIKRLFDIVLSVFGIIVLCPLLTCCALLIKREGNGPVFYRGERIGRGGEPFQIYKFRTMVENAEKLGGSSTPDDDSRLTKIGKKLRKYKLDELPQLVNVLKGEMSMVGPRPQVSWAVELYGTEESRLLDIRPGITDYASIQFRDEAAILKGSSNPDEDYLEKIAPEKLRLGLQYVDTMSLWTDLKIIFRTLTALFKNQ